MFSGIVEEMAILRGIEHEQEEYPLHLQMFIYKGIED